MQIVKVFNNNVVMADDGGSTVVLTGRGLGFQVRPGDQVPMERVAQVFRPADESAMASMAAFLLDVAPEDVNLAARILANACAALGVDFRPNNVIPLADHLNFAIKRARSGLSVEYPLAVEVPHLFPAEYAFARTALDQIEVETGVRLPAGEAIPIALHFVNASFATPDMPQTFKLAGLLDQIFDVLESTVGPIDRHSISAARLVAHLRYFFVRHEAGRALPREESSIVAVIRAEHPAAFASATRLKQLLELRLGSPISEPEVAYLAVHVARLVGDLADRPSPNLTEEDR